MQCTLFLLSLGHRAAAFWQQPSQLSFPLLSSLFSPDIISHTKETKKKKKFTDRSLLWENGGRLFPLLQEKGRGERDVYRKVFSSYVCGIICCSARTPVCQNERGISSSPHMHSIIARFRIRWFERSRAAISRT